MYDTNYETQCSDRFLKGYALFQKIQVDTPIFNYATAHTPKCINTKVSLRKKPFFHHITDHVTATETKRQMDIKIHEAETFWVFCDSWSSKEVLEHISYVAGTQC